MSMPSEKAPGLDRFIGLFYKKCWVIVRGDLVDALQAFHSLVTHRLDLINEANIVLIPETKEATRVADF